MVLHGAPLRVRPRAKDTQRQEDGRVWAAGQPACGQPGRGRRGARRPVGPRSAAACGSYPAAGSTRSTLQVRKQGPSPMRSATGLEVAKPGSSTARVPADSQRGAAVPSAWPLGQKCRRLSGLSCSRSSSHRYGRKSITEQRNIRPLNSPWQADRAVGRA